MIVNDSRRSVHLAVNTLSRDSHVVLTYDGVTRPASLLYYIMAAETGVEVGNFNLAYLCEENVVRWLLTSLRRVSSTIRVHDCTFSTQDEQFIFDRICSHI